MRLWTPAARRRAAVWIGAIGATLGAAWWLMIRMPGESWRGALPPATPELPRLAEALRLDVANLAGEIGERNLYRPDALGAAADHVEAALRTAGLAPARQTFDVGGRACANVEAEARGRARPDEIVVVGAHYDSAPTSPGADDNASGVAAMIALAQAFAARPAARTIRFVAFTNEEPPHFTTDAMGSRRAARRSRERGERIAAMISLESLGYYDPRTGSQRYPFPLGLLYPSAGDFVAFVGNVRSRALVREALATFRAAARLPSEGAALPWMIPGVGWSDHWSYWREGYRAIMVTDTALFRNPHYHTNGDLPETLDYERFARAVAGIEPVVERLAGGR